MEHGQNIHLVGEENWFVPGGYESRNYSLYVYIYA